MLKRVCLAPMIGSFALAGSASAVFDTTMYSVSENLATFTNLVGTLDIASTAYNFPFDNMQYSTSGYVREVGGNPIDTTGLVTNVYQVTSQTTVGGGFQLNAGDMIWAYTIDLVSASANTVASLAEFQVGGFSFLGTDVMDGSLINGYGFLTPGAGVDTPLGNPGDFEDLGGLGSSVDWQWSNDVAFQLGNDETITLLMFTSAALIGEGVANFIAPPIQAAGVDPVANGAPVLIPIAIPAPGAAGLLVGMGLMAARRRR